VPGHSAGAIGFTMAEPNWIISRAHQWHTHPRCQQDAQSWPAKNMVKCTRCGMVCIIGEWEGPRCKAHFERSDSGFVDES
jgi:hypothetical protein